MNISSGLFWLTNDIVGFAVKTSLLPNGNRYVSNLVRTGNGAKLLQADVLFSSPTKAKHKLKDTKSHWSGPLEVCQ